MSEVVPTAIPPASAAGAILPTEPAAPPPAGARWFDPFSADDKAYLTTKGWDKEGKGPGDVLKSYRALEKLRGVGEDRLVVLPDPANPNEMEAFYQRLGVPKTAAEYGTSAFEVSGNPVDTSLLDNMSHAIKHTPAQHETFISTVAEFLGTTMQEQNSIRAERDAGEKMTLEREWGPTLQENYAASAKAAIRFGIDSDMMTKIQDGLGYRKTVELFTTIGRAFGEGKGPVPTPGGGGAEPFGVTPTVAKQRMDELKRDEGFRAKLLSGDIAARDKWEGLKKVAFSVT